jgi:hypothetical protein
MTLANLKNQVIDLPVPTGKTALMQYLQTLVLRGNAHWVGGVVSPSKLGGLVAKFAAQYPITRSERGRTYDHSRGRASVHFVAFSTTGGVAWWLLSSEGKGGLNDSNSPDHRVKRHAMQADGHIVFDDYVLLYAHKQDARVLVDAKTGRERRVIKDCSTWTWKLTASALGQITTIIAREVAALNFGNDAPNQMSGLRGLLAFQRRRPLFSGVRTQVIQLHRQAESQWGLVRLKWASEHQQLVAALCEGAGQLSSLREVTSTLLPTMGRFKIFGSTRVADLAEGVRPLDDAVVPAAKLKRPVAGAGESRSAAASGRRTPGDPLVAAEIAMRTAARALLVEAGRLRASGLRLTNMRSTNTNLSSCEHALDRLQARANSLRGDAFQTFENACKEAQLMVAMKRRSAGRTGVAASDAAEHEVFDSSQRRQLMPSR